MNIPSEWLIQRAQTRMENLKAMIAANQIDEAKEELGIIAGILVSIVEYTDENHESFPPEIDQIQRQWQPIRRQLAFK